MKYIDVEKLKAEIDNKLLHEQGFEDGNSEYGYKCALKDIKRVIAALQQEQPEVKLNEHRIADIIQNLFPTNQFIESESLLLDKEEAILFARHFYELGLNVREK